MTKFPTLKRPPANVQDPGALRYGDSAITHRKPVTDRK